MCNNEGIRQQDKGHSIVVIHDGQEIKLSAQSNSRLLHVLRNNHFFVSTPCGAKGLCRKCRVEVEGEGSILSCQYLVSKDIRVELPRVEQAARIQTEALHIREFRLDPGMLLPEGKSYGLGVDIGTTTVVIYLVDLRTGLCIDTFAFLNPQNEFGQDVISRINFVIERQDGLVVLQQRILHAINDGLQVLCRNHSVRAEQIIKAVFAGNTVMLHLLLGVNPRSIATAPFTPVFTEERILTGQELGLAVALQGRVIIMPSVSGYVGADITAGLAATPISEGDDLSLFIDIGTNGEMALGNKNGFLCCSTAAGPAFEGARIECGTAGVAGAIAHFHRGAYETIGEHRPVGICGSGLLDLVAHLLDQGLVSPEGLLEKPFLVERGARTATGSDIIITPRDIRETQLAKAAIHAGVKVLLRNAGASLTDIRHVYLAGGFGSYLDIKSALRIGLLPPELEGRITAVGNTAGAGAFLCVRSEAFREEVKSVTARCKYLELSGRADFSDEYMDALLFSEDSKVLALKELS